MGQTPRAAPLCDFTQIDLTQIQKFRRLTRRPTSQLQGRERERREDLTGPGILSQHGFHFTGPG
jgi:hypothetical protein